MTPTRLHQLVASSLAELKDWVDSLSAIVRESLGVENQIIEAIEKVLEQKECEVCEDLVAELNQVDVHQRVILVGTGTPPPASPVNSRSSAGQHMLSREPSQDFMHVSRSPDEEAAPLPRLHFARHSAATRSTDSLPVRGSLRSSVKQLPTGGTPRAAPGQP